MALLKNCSVHTDQLKGKLKEIIENNREKIELSKKLATIELNVPVELKEDELILETPDREKLKELFNELEFRTIAAEILSEIDKTAQIRQTGNYPRENCLGTDSGYSLRGK